MSADETNPDFDNAEALDHGELMIDESGEGEGEEEEGSPAELQQAAQAIDFVCLPIACTNEGQGRPAGDGHPALVGPGAGRGRRQGGRAGVHRPARAAGPQDPRADYFPRAVDRPARARGHPALRQRPPRPRHRHARARGSAASQRPHGRAQWLRRRRLAHHPRPAGLCRHPRGRPAKLFELQQGIANRLGLAATSKTWQEAFGSENIQALASSSASATSARCRAAACRPPPSSCSPR